VLQFLREIFRILSTLASADVTPVISAVDQCCSTLGSKIDALASADVTPVLSALDQCCFTLESKIDALGATSGVSSDSCCFTGTCDIDQANLTVIQWLKTIYRDIRGFVTPNVSECPATGPSCLGTICP
jgi:hypothetical protein